MRERSMRVLTLLAVLLLAAAGAVVAGGGVWVSDTGDEHEVGSHAIFLDDDGDFFDLSDLEDGETRLFGSGDKQISASRVGDTISVERPAGGDERAIHVACHAGRDTCKVMTFGENDEKVALMIKKRHAGHHVMTLDEDVMLGEDGEAIITITEVGDCTDDVECGEHSIRVLDGSTLSGEMVVEVVGSVGHADASKNIWISADGPHSRRQILMVDDGATKHSLSDLYDGETRVFGYGEKQVTAVRAGDEVSISRPQSGKDDDLLVNCTIGRDTCQVLTYDDDPEKVAVVIAKAVHCGDGEDCSDLLRLQMEDGRDGAFEVIELREGGAGNVYVNSPEGEVRSIRRIKIVTEKED